ncbi:trimeric intracellular cation channel family protein [Collinsella intestinalis]|uniref:Trimeric intracellular cation channel family protein n=1 Tax=Collinsella intestinalis TaxID=147207 RepID=A0A414NEY3_9ACTN|nr:TRIC cation channel family protein [Collinsella intestinalis]RHF38201.1 trimeric intracellular cation channel family protein [Collinsella intestinalis]
MFPAVLAVTQSAVSASVIASESVAIPLAFELFAVVVAAATGALTARENKLDLVGAIGLAVLVSLGGGLIRDVILQEGNVYILRQPLALPVAVATAAAVFTFPVMVEKPDRLVAVLDIFSVGLFAVMGADKTMLYGYPAITCVMMGFFTAVGGGLLRDVCLARVPYIFQRSNLYAIAAIAGALTYIVLVQYLDIWNIAAAVISVAVTMAVRWWSIRYNIMSPTEVDLHKLPEPVKKVARPVVRPVRKAAQHVSTKTSRAAEQARLRKIERQHKRDRQRETRRHRR